MSNSLRIALGFGLITLAAISYLHNSSTAYPFGWSGATGKPGSFTYGCTCHNQEPSQETSVTISSSAKNFEPGKTYEFIVHTSNPAQVAAGVGISAFAGVLDTIEGEGLQTDQNSMGELIHYQPKGFINGRTDWRFLYTAPSDRTTDTIYAVANAVNGNGGVDEGDLWNAAPKYVITIGSAKVDQQKPIDVQVMPNPASDRLVLKASSMSPDRYHLMLIDATGKTVLQESINISGALNHSIDIRSIAAGLYSIRLENSVGIVFNAKAVIRR
ncbi:MAG TPA: choice-of-anchor V domain-containing protein [Candidatus Kapabacteria bacterium]|nr:choice-of-anchor V domain-containing protein [Candidatus Kapabacteria bacterium]